MGGWGSERWPRFRQHRAANLGLGETPPQVSWLTPVEIFQPHYGRVIARRILARWQQLQQQQQQAGGAEPPPQQQQLLRIYELGGGTGTLALNVLDWLRERHPAAYALTRYRCLDISPPLAAAQAARVRGDGGHAPPQVGVWEQDGADGEAWARNLGADAEGEARAALGRREGDASEHAAAGAVAGATAAAGAAGGGQDHGFVVMCEVLDNLPHDR